MPYSHSPAKAANAAAFDRDGYLLLDVFDQTEISRLQHMVEELVSQRPLPNPRIAIHDALPTASAERFPGNPYATYHVVNTVLAGDKWFALMCEPRLVDVVDSLIGPSVNFDMGFLRLRPPGLRMEAPWHRDVDTDASTDERTVTALIYLSEMRAESGATRVIPKSRGAFHLRDLDSQTVTEEELEAASEPVNASAGSVLFLSPTVVHRGGWNQTAQETGAIVFEYRAAGNLRTAYEDDLAYCDLPVARPGWRLVPPSAWAS